MNQGICPSQTDCAPVVRQSLPSSRFLNKELLCRIHGSIPSISSSFLCSGGLQSNSSETSRVDKFNGISGIETKLTTTRIDHQEISFKLRALCLRNNDFTFANIRPNFARAALSVKSRDFTFSDFNIPGNFIVGNEHYTENIRKEWSLVKRREWIKAVPVLTSTSAVYRTLPQLSENGSENLE